MGQAGGAESVVAAPEVLHPDDSIALKREYLKSESGLPGVANVGGAEAQDHGIAALDHLDLIEAKGLLRLRPEHVHYLVAVVAHEVRIDPLPGHIGGQPVLEMVDAAGPLRHGEVLD
jgi:hypothetical protein